jgi:Ca-activated chloride channel family protein
MMADFHFIRPWWLFALVPVLWVAWAVWRDSDTKAPWRGIIAEPLLPYLVRGGGDGGNVWPTRVLVASWLLATLVLAGPSWRRVPSPFADEVAPLAIVIQVTPSMVTEDVAPSRLTRSVQKIHDLLAARGKSKAGLIAYAGTPHTVMPLTTDPGIIDTFAASLEPKIMPNSGDDPVAALKLADSMLGRDGGAILWITDGIPPEQSGELKAWRKSSRTPVQILAPLNPSPELDQLAEAADAVNATVIPISPDNEDIDRILRDAKSAPGTGTEGGDRWQDSGYWLTPLLALLILPFFRRGWMPSAAARS